jgi:hypothetical protein
MTTSRVENVDVKNENNWTIIHIKTYFPIENLVEYAKGIENLMNNPHLKTKLNTSSCFDSMFGESSEFKLTSINENIICVPVIFFFFLLIFIYLFFLK